MPHTTRLAFYYAWTFVGVPVLSLLLVWLGAAVWPSLDLGGWIFAVLAGIPVALSAAGALTAGVADRLLGGPVLLRRRRKAAPGLVLVHGHRPPLRRSSPT